MNRIRFLFSNRGTITFISKIHIWTLYSIILSLFKILYFTHVQNTKFVSQLTMRLNKILFLVFLVLYFIAGLSLLITGSVAHRHASQCKCTFPFIQSFDNDFFSCRNYRPFNNVWCWFRYCSWRDYYSLIHRW